MKLPFLDRADEVERLRRALRGKDCRLAVLYGRRRCGKSTLLQQVVTPGDVYFLADQRDARLQIQAFAAAVDAVIPDFSAARYDSWDAVLTSLRSRAPGKLNVVLDEFPYLVQSAPELPSILQRYIDSPGSGAVNWVLCGSSQRMMQGAVLDRKAPLYGRAREILNVRPLRAGWIVDALGLDPRASMVAYSVWGGVPRYWELACSLDSTEEAMRQLVLDRNGVLHDEPSRLLRDEMRSSVQAQSMLSLIGAGCHRLSEIAGRLGKPASSLTRPLNNLVEMGLVGKELPWGESARSTKRVLCRIADPFVAFHCRFVVPNKSLLEIGRTESVLNSVMSELGPHCALIWEHLARESVPFSAIAGREWRDAARWWGHDMRGDPAELDVVAESMDRKSILLGEVKWGASSMDLERELARLKMLASRVPFVKRREPVFAVWSPSAVKPPAGLEAQTPTDVLGLLRG